MPSFASSDRVTKVDPRQTLDYDSGNPLTKLFAIVERQHLAAGRHFYLTDELQVLLPFDHLEFSGPQGVDADVLDPTRQDNKTDFQKQNVRNFFLTDTYLLRGWVAPNAWDELDVPKPIRDRIVPFLKLSYRAGPDSKLAEAMGDLPGRTIRLYVKVNGREAGDLIAVPYNVATGRYEIELWGDHGSDLGKIFSKAGDDRALGSLERGELITRPDMIRGLKSDFDREGRDDADIRSVAPDNTMHPLHPLQIEVAWADESARFWDSKSGANYRYEFNMMVRGWDAYLKAGISANPHGGLGVLHYRNLLSNYLEFADSNELGRLVEPWQFNAMGLKKYRGFVENFFAIDYIDLHLMKSQCGIGLHRHRDNQEVFFLLQGKATMVVADWYQFFQRERCFELRTLRAGEFCLLKPGGVHGMMNATDSDISLLMFGGYD